MLHPQDRDGEEDAHPGEVTLGGASVLPDTEAFRLELLARLGSLPRGFVQRTERPCVVQVQPRENSEP